MLYRVRETGMDELLQKALERRERLRAELEAIDRFIASYSSINDRPEPGELFNRTPAPQSSRAERAEAVRAMIADAEHLILNEGKPLTRRQLLERLIAAGHRLDGTDKSKVLGTNLWRSDRFWNLKGAGYWPKASPLPQQYTGHERRNTISR